MVLTISTESTIHATAPHSVNCAIVSTSLVTLRHESTATLVDVVGERQPVDVLEGPDAQPQQARLRGAHQPQEGGAADHVQDDRERGGERAGGGHEARSVALVPEHAAAQDLLDQDRDGELADRRQHGESHGEQQALSQLRGHRQAAAQHRHGTGAAEVLLLVGLVRAVALVVVAAGRRRVGEDVDDGVVIGGDGLGHAASNLRFGVEPSGGVGFVGAHERGVGGDRQQLLVACRTPRSGPRRAAARGRRARSSTPGGRRRWWWRPRRRAGDRGSPAPPSGRRPTSRRRAGAGAAGAAALGPARVAGAGRRTA